MSKFAIITAILCLSGSALIHVVGPPTTKPEVECCIACGMMAEASDLRPVILTLNRSQTKSKSDHSSKEHRTPILGAITRGDVTAIDPPSDDEVVFASVAISFRPRPVSNVRILKEKIADYLDPPRDVPLIGPAQLHHAHYKCTIYYTVTTRVGWPASQAIVVEEELQDVVYIDHNHFHVATASSEDSRASPLQ